MITKEELGWTQQQWDDFAAATGDVAYEFILEQYSLGVSEKSDTSGTVTNDATVDAVLCNDVIIRTWAITDNIKYSRLANEDSSPQSWAVDSAVTATNIDTAVAPSLVASGNTVRVFWINTSGNIYYNESTDKGENWGSANLVGTNEAIEFLAATKLTRVHACQYVGSEWSWGKHNWRPSMYEYSGSTWNVDVGGYLTWPFEITSFDAVNMGQFDDAAAADNDLIAFTSDIAPLIKTRVDGTEVVKNLERIQAVCCMRWQDNRYSDIRPFDKIDRVGDTVPRRDSIRLSKIGDYAYMVYRRKDGADNFIHSSIAVTRSKTGLHWELPYLFQTPRDTPTVLLRNGDWAYFIDSTKAKKYAYSTDFVGSAAYTHDLTSYLGSVDIMAQDSREVNVTINNPGGVLNSILWDRSVMWRMRISLGWVVDDVHRTVDYIVADVENLSKRKDGPSNMIVLSGRNVIGRMAALKADYVQEWENFQSGGDNFQAMDETSFSGLRKTAPYAGFWEANNNVLQLKSSEEVGIAFNIQTRDVWNGSCQSAVSVASTETTDFVGLIFRGHDKYNFWYVAFDADAGYLQLVERKNNTDTVRYGMPSSWTFDTWYWLKVIYRYSIVIVETSLDGVVWTHAFTYEIRGVDPAADFTFDNVPLQSGSQGYIGHGYTEYAPEFPEPPSPPPPWIPPPEAEDPRYGKKVYVATFEKGVYQTGTFTEPFGAMPAWAAINTGLTPGNYIRYLVIDPFDGDKIQYCIPGPSGWTEYGDVYRRSNYKDWEVILTAAGATSLTGYSTTLIYSIAIDDQNPKYFYVLAHSAVSGYATLIKSMDYGETWANAGDIGTGASAGQGMHLHVSGDLMMVGHIRSSTINHYWVSDNGGSSWDLSDALSDSLWNLAVAAFSKANLTPHFTSRASGVNDLARRLGTSGYEKVSTMDSFDLSLAKAGRMWMDRELTGTMKIVDTGPTPHRHFWTRDSWANEEHTDLPKDVTLVWSKDDNVSTQIFADNDDAGAGDPHHIFASEDNGIVLTGKAGDNPEGSPFTDSIPHDCGGVTRNGLQPVDDIDDVPDMAWAATWNFMYETTNFDSEDQPHWDQVTTEGDFDDGPLTLDGTLFMAGFDPLRPDYYKYVLFTYRPTVETYNFVSILDTSPSGSGEWEKVLREEDVQDSGHSYFCHALAEIECFTVDPVTGYLWVSVSHKQISNVWIFKSEDRGATWDIDNITPTPVDYYNSGGELRAFNDVCVYGWGPISSPLDVHVYWTLNGGTSWDMKDFTGWGGDPPYTDPATISHIFLHPASYETDVYLVCWDVDKWGSNGIIKLTFSTKAATLVHVLDEYSPTIYWGWYTSDIMAGDPKDPDSMLILFMPYYEEHDEFWTLVTTDDWSTTTKYTPEIDGEPAGRPQQLFQINPRKWSLLVYGQCAGVDIDNEQTYTEQTLAICDGFEDPLPIGKSGSMPDTSPWTGSIPMPPEEYYLCDQGAFFSHWSSRLGTNVWDEFIT